VADLPTGQLVKWKEQDYPTVYANIIGFGMSPFDIFVIFGQIGESTPSEVNAIPKVKVLLSPEQALNLKKLLGLAVDAYAANNGQLRTSGEVNLADIDDQMKALKIKPLT
jgi:hypothetical protein